MSLDLQSVSYIDNREFPGADALPHGPYGYEGAVYAKAINLVPNVMFLLINWLADGVLVSSAPDSVTWVPDISYPSSFTVVVLFTPRTTGSPLFRA